MSEYFKDSFQQLAGISPEALEVMKDSIGDLLTQLNDDIGINNAKKEIIENFKNEGLTKNQIEENVTAVTEELDKAYNESMQTARTATEKQFLTSIHNLYRTKLEEILQANYSDATIHVQLCHPNAKMPQFAHPYDAGADVYAVEDTTIPGGETMIIPTGLRMAIPQRWMVSIRPRSGVSAKTGLRISNSPATIDPGYLQEIGVIVTNTSNEPYTIHAGDRIAQFVFEKRYTIEFSECDDVNQFSTINRENTAGKAGFGSTGD